jgi:hypothetical protein
MPLQRTYGTHKRMGNPFSGNILSMTEHFFRKISKNLMVLPSMEECPKDGAVETAIVQIYSNLLF